MGKLIDLTNQRFGKLVVLKYIGKMENKKGSPYWECQCDCGNIVYVLGSQLRYGKTKSCGCAKYDGLKEYNLIQSENNKIDIGTRFDKLIVIEDLGLKKHVEGHNRRWYLCKCDCGNEKEVMGNSLKNKHISSCGKCNMNSQGEYEIEQLLIKYNINYQHDIVFEELYKETKRRLRFDFILYDENFSKPIRFIEFDGRQHKSGGEAVWSKSSSLEIIQERDNVKNEFCLKHNYPLIRIPCDKLHNIKIEDILSDKYIVKGDD